MHQCLKIVLVFALSMFAGGVYSQTTNNNCANATPFCTGQTMNFPATTGVQNSQQGPFYGCLGSQPNPAWFFMQVANSGPMSISMSATWDIDFICWGPFPNLSGACGNLVQSNVQDCSYSGSPTETCTIANAVAGQFYILLITNFSNQVQNISFNQNNAGAPGAGSTNCGFVCVVSPTNSGIICAGGAVTVSLTPATSSAVTTWTWTGPNSFSSTSAVNVIPNLQASGNYTVQGTANATLNGTPYSGTCQAVTAVSVVPYPSFSVTPSYTSICQGGNFVANVSFIPPLNPGPYSYTWATSSGGLIWAPFSSSSLMTPTLLPTTTTLATRVYSVTVSPSQLNCPITKTMTVSINNPLTPTIAIPPPLCDTYSPVQLSATPGGGTWSANPAVTQGGLFTPAIAAIGTSTVKYAMSVGTCVVANTTTVAVSKYYSPALSNSVSTRCVQDPLFNLMTVVQSTVTGKWSGTQVSSNFFNSAGLATGNYSLTYHTHSLPDSLVCPASTVLIVPVFNPPTPVIGNILPRCNNAGTVALTATPPGGVWSGNSGVSANGIQTPSLNIINTNSVTYTAGQGTCVASSSKTFHVSQYNSAALTATLPELCVSSNTVNLMGIVQNSTGIWAGPGVSNDVFNPAVLPTGIYKLTYTSFSYPDPNLCPATSSIDVSVLNPPTPVIKQVGPYCNTNPPVQLTVNPSAGGHWVPSFYLSASGVFNPSLSPVGSNAVQYVIGTNTCNVKQTINIQTEAFVSAAITGSISDLCNTSPAVNLVPHAASSLGIWSGTGVLGTSFYPSVSGAGQYILHHNTASSPSGLCPDHATVAVNVYSLAPPAITKVGPFCNKSEPVQLQVSPVGGLFGSGRNGLVSSNGVFNPAMGAIGDNMITYSLSVGPCIAYAQAHIQVEAFVSAAFEKYPDQAYCRNDQSFNLNSLVQNPGGMWTGPGVTGNMFDPSKANIGDNNIITYQTHSSPSSLLCPDVSTVQIRVKDVPEVAVLSDIESGCPPLEVKFHTPSVNSGKGVWNLSDGTTQEGFFMTHVFTSPGTYSAVFSYSDGEAKGCSAQAILKNEIKVYEMPKADFSVSPDEITISNPEVSFTNLSTKLSDNVYQWSIQGMEQVYQVNPSVTFPQVGNYKVSLKATSIHGCKDEISKIVSVKNDFNVYIPNSFTPNADGLNDIFIPVFSPYGLDPKTFEMEIFDRWGHELYRSRDITKGWDGTFQNKGDTPLKQDTYVFNIKYKDMEGKVYTRNGTLILLND